MKWCSTFKAFNLWYIKASINIVKLNVNNVYIHKLLVIVILLSVLILTILSIKK